MSDFNCELPDFSPKMDRLMKYMAEESKRLAPNRLYLDNSSNGTQRYGELTACHPYHQLNLFSNIAEEYVKNRGRIKPMVFGEYADTDSVRDTMKIKTQYGGKLPWWWKRFNICDPFEKLMQQGIEESEIYKITRASVENAQEAKKYYIEETKKNPDVAALFITHKNDVGPTIPGFFDELGDFRFDEEKLYQSARENVLLLDISSFNLKAGAKTKAALLLAPNGAGKITRGFLSWSVESAGGSVIASGENSAEHLNGKASLQIRPEIIEFAAPEAENVMQLRLSARFTCREFSTENAWNLWIYPKSQFTGGKLAVYDPSGALRALEYYPDAEIVSNGDIPANTELVLATEISPFVDNYLKSGGTLLYAGIGSEYLPVSRVYNWNAYSMPYVPGYAEPILGDMGKRGFGCLDFLDLFTEYAIDRGTEKGTVYMRRIEMRTYNVSSYIKEAAVKDGRLIQTTLRLAESAVDVLRGGGIWLDTQRENVAGRYLLDRLIQHGFGTINEK